MPTTSIATAPARAIRRSLSAALGTVMTALAATLAVPSTAQAQASYQADFAFAAGNAVPVGYLTFDVLTAGTFRLYSITPSPFDPEITLYTGPRASLGTLVAQSDDGCRTNPLGLAGCPGSSNVLDGFFAPVLVGGQTYTLVVGQWAVTEQEARAGFQGVSQAFESRLVLDSPTGTAGNFVVTNGTGPSSTVPEPGTWALLGTGLAGLAGVARRRRVAVA
jgi:hypothetical protein